MPEFAPKKPEQSLFSAPARPETTPATAQASPEATPTAAQAGSEAASAAAQAGPKLKPAAAQPAVSFRVLKDDYPPGKYQPNPPLVDYNMDPAGAAAQRGEAVLERVKSKNHTSISIAKDDSNTYWFGWVDAVTQKLQQKGHPGLADFSAICATYSTEIKAALEQADNTMFRVSADV